MSEYAEMVDDEDYTYERVQYAQVGQCHNLGDEVRELRAKVKMQEYTINYWRTCYNDLALAVSSVKGLYGWGECVANVQACALIRKDIQGLRARVRELEGRK